MHGVRRMASARRFNCEQESKLSIQKTTIWTLLKASIKRELEVFQVKCLRRMIKIFWPNTIWPNTISNEEQGDRAGTCTLTETIQQVRWRCVPHASKLNSRAALRWTPQRRRNRGRRTVEKDLKSRDLSLQTAPRATTDRTRRRSLVVASRATRHRED
ncbi:uncharacterized protein LOC112576144 [Pomacea canaliculata]|uniref:uncharacterized protein LOC112576144 n=1 Tax=Pomacea canaliculata TaxID=400727 RepID=UPI000D735527|nr:uncharacterized protein LOC112576144 [Pomacea canaliculata]